MLSGKSITTPPFLPRTAMLYALLIISKKDSAYSGIVIIKKKSSTSNQFEKFAYVTNGKYYYNSSTTTTLPSEGVGKINTKTEVKDGGSSNLTFKKCCEFYDNCN